MCPGENSSNVDSIDLCNIQLFVSNDYRKYIIQKKQLNCSVAKTLISSYHAFFVKLQVFQREYIRIYSVIRTQIFINDCNCHVPSKYVTRVA